MKKIIKDNLLTIVSALTLALFLNHYYYILGKNDLHDFFLKEYYKNKYENQQVFLIHKSINNEINKRIIVLCSQKTIHTNLMEINCATKN